MSEKSKISFPGLKIGRSLKLRLFIIIFLVGIIPCTIIYQVILSNYEDRAVKVRISDVQNQLKVIADHLITYNYLPDSSSEVINAELEQLSNLYNGRVMIINGSLKIVKDTYGLSEGKTIVSEEVIKCFKGSNTANYDRVNGFIEITVPIMETISEQNATPEQPEGTEVVRGVMLTSVSIDSIAMTLSILSRKALIIEIIMALCILALAIILAKILIRPFDRVSGAISEVQEGYTNETISVPDYIETEHIVDAFNSLLQRINALDETRQDFVANVSHELKTPITSMKVLADSLIAQEDVPVELYREFMVDIAEEIERVKSVNIGTGAQVQALMQQYGSTELKTGATLAELIKRPELSYQALAPLDTHRPQLREDIAEQVNINLKYEGYIERQLRQVEHFKKLEKRIIPETMDYTAINGLRVEAMQKLEKFRPHSIGQASRISGVSPADISVLLVYMEQFRRRK